MSRITELWSRFLPSFEVAYSAVQSETDYFEIVPPNQSKGSALLKLTALLNIPRSEVMSVGNELNDVDMIEQAGIGVAVANSHPDLKSKAAYVCSKSFGEGVVEAMERFA